eukprot:8756-Heterococcus_DN1.PRE.1
MGCQSGSSGQAHTMYGSMDSSCDSPVSVAEEGAVHERTVPHRHVTSNCRWRLQSANSANTQQQYTLPVNEIRYYYWDCQARDAAARTQESAHGILTRKATISQYWYASITITALIEGLHEIAYGFEISMIRIVY